MKAGTVTCRFALADPSHVCFRRDGRRATGHDECHEEHRAQLDEQGRVLRTAEAAAAAAEEGDESTAPGEVRGRLVSTIERVLTRLADLVGLVPHGGRQ